MLHPGNSLYIRDQRGGQVHSSFDQIYNITRKFKSIIAIYIISFILYQISWLYDIDG